MQTTVYLIRHGEIDNPTGKYYGRIVDVPLNHLGREQLKDLVEAIMRRGDRLSALIASPRKRTQQSAEILAKRFGDVPIETLQELEETETDGFAEWQVKDILSLPDMFANPPDGVVVEDRNKMIARMKGAFQTALSRYPGKTIGIVSHGNPITYLVWSLLHTGEPFPPHKEAVKAFDPKKGNGWRLVFDEKGKLLSHELVLSDEGK